MSNDRLDKMEWKVDWIVKVVYKIEASIESIVKNIETALSVKDDVTTHTEKHKVTEARLDNLEKKDAKIDDKINNINLKIATFSGIWMAWFFAIKEVFFK